MFRTIVLLLAALSLPVLGQDVQLPMVSPTVQKFVEKLGANILALEPSCPSMEACAHMNYHVKTYHMNGVARIAFEELLAQRPDVLWTGASNFQMQYDPESGEFLGREQELHPIREKQVMFLELQVTKKMLIPVAFQIVKLDRENLSMAFSYIKNNKSSGIQHLRFVQEVDGFSIVHETRYQSDSKFRDKFLYGIFHTKFLNQFYNNFKKIQK